MCTPLVEIITPIRSGVFGLNVCMKIKKAPQWSSLSSSRENPLLDSTPPLGLSRGLSRPSCAPVTEPIKAPLLVMEYLYTYGKDVHKELHSQCYGQIPAHSSSHHCGVLWSCCCFSLFNTTPGALELAVRQSSFRLKDLSGQRFFTIQLFNFLFLRASRI